MTTLNFLCLQYITWSKDSRSRAVDFSHCFKYWEGYDPSPENPWIIISATYHELFNIPWALQHPTFDRDNQIQLHIQNSSYLETFYTATAEVADVGDLAVCYITYVCSCLFRLVDKTGHPTPVCRLVMQFEMKGGGMKIWKPLASNGIPSWLHTQHSCDWLQAVRWPMKARQVATISEIKGGVLTLTTHFHITEPALVSSEKHFSTWSVYIDEIDIEPCDSIVRYYLKV